MCTFVMYVSQIMHQVEICVHVGLVPTSLPVFRHLQYGSRDGLVHILRCITKAPTRNLAVTELLLFKGGNTWYDPLLWLNQSILWVNNQSPSYISGCHGEITIFNITYYAYKGCHYDGSSQKSRNGKGYHEYMVWLAIVAFITIYGSSGCYGHTCTGHIW